MAPRTRAKRPKLARRQRLSLEELDVLLDVRVADFDRVVRQLVKEFRSQSVSVEIPYGTELLALRPFDTRLSWVGVYEAQAQRLARHDRAEEFLMARRYEFLRARAVAALEEVGYDAEQIPALLRAGSTGLPPAPKKPTAAQRKHLTRALDELEALRNRYVEGALYMVIGVAHRYRNLGVDFTDLIQEGNASLFQAIDGFDWRRDVRFKTYAQYWIHQAMLKVLYNSSRTVRVPIWVQKALAKINKVRERERSVDGSPPSAKVVGERLGLTEERVRELLQTKRFAVSLDAEVAGEDGLSLAQVLADESSADVAELTDDDDLGACLNDVLDDLPSRERLILQRRYGLEGREPETLAEIAVDLGITAERVRQLQKAALERLKKPVTMNRLRAYA